MTPTEGYTGPAGVAFTETELDQIRTWAAIFPETSTVAAIREKIDRHRKSAELNSQKT